MTVFAQIQQSELLNVKLKENCFIELHSNIHNSELFTSQIRPPTETEIRPIFVSSVQTERPID